MPTLGKKKFAYTKKGKAAYKAAKKSSKMNESTRKRMVKLVAESYELDEIAGLALGAGRLLGGAGVRLGKAAGAARSTLWQAGQRARGVAKKGMDIAKKGSGEAWKGAKHLAFDATQKMVGANVAADQKFDKLKGKVTDWRNKRKEDALSKMKKSPTSTNSKYTSTKTDYSRDSIASKLGALAQTQAARANQDRNIQTAKDKGQSPSTAAGNFDRFGGQEKDALSSMKEPIFDKRTDRQKQQDARKEKIDTRKEKGIARKKRIKASALGRKYSKSILPDPDDVSSGNKAQF